MIRYSELVNYIKENHINWNTDLFDVLKGFFSQYSQQPSLPSTHSIQQDLDWEISEVPIIKEFQHPADGEYTPDDLLNLFST